MHIRWAGVTGLLLTAVVLAADDFKPEEGFKLLFNGKDLTGWKAKKGGESLDGKTETPDKRFVVKDGLLVIDDTVKGDVRIVTAKELAKDVRVKFDFRPGAGCNNDVLFRGFKFDLSEKDAKNMKAGEWNAFELTVTGDKAEARVNGELMKAGKVTMPSGVLELRAEFKKAEFRRLRVKDGS